MRDRRAFLVVGAGASVLAATGPAGAVGPADPAPVTEVGILPIKPEAEAAYRRAYYETLPTLTQRSGYLGHSWGRRVEDGPLTYVILVRWASLADHRAFAASPEYPAYVGAISGHLAGPPQFFHIDTARSLAP